MPTKHLALIFALTTFAPFASAAIVDFDGATTTSLPYTEAGLTFSNTGATNVIVVGGADGYLTSGTNDLSIRVRVTGSQSFDLELLDIESISRTWRIESSSGAVVNPSSTGTIDFTNLIGWTNLSSFELIHDPGEANGTIRVDNIAFVFVPEPSSAALLFFGPAAMLLYRRRLTSDCS